MDGSAVLEESNGEVGDERVCAVDEWYDCGVSAPLTVL